MRLFYLENEKGERQDLTSKTGILFANPEGLGIELENDYADLSKGFFKKVFDENVPQSNIVGDIYFLEGYLGYRNFVDWITRSEELYLIYIPEDTEYRRNVEIAYITKTELVNNQYLQSTISFECLTPWYTPINIVLGMGEAEGTPMQFEFQFINDLTFSPSIEGKYSADILNTSQLPGSIEFKYKGVINNPEITLVNDVTKQIIGKCDIEASFSENDTLEFSSMYLKAHAKKIDIYGNETDLIDSVDITKNPFFKVPINVPCKLIINSDDAFGGTASAVIYYYYRSV